TQLAPATVLPVASSISCAKTPRFERNTARRGRSAVPATLPRTRRWRRSRAWRVVRLLMPHLRPAPAPAKPAPPRARVRPCHSRRSWSLRQAYGTCSLPDLPAHELALVADALALVRLRRAHLADLRRRLADELLVDAAHDHLRRRRHLELDPLARRDAH